ncbi:MAG: gamma-glutamyltransferase [Bdellovibrionaceae bacterium]|nr:gamma-glutamyltransferase [Pseudobdellovibrionaceae bacterium]
MKNMMLGLILSLFSISSTTFALPYKAQEFAVASPSPYSASVANEIAKSGGNLFDQTIGVALALAVTHPYYASLGGGGFAIIRKNNPGAAPTVDVLDFREIAPMASNRESFIGRGDKAATDGGMASGVPGVPAGLQEMHKKYGKVAWRKLFAPAIRLAEQGFPVSGEWAEQTKAEFENFTTLGKKTFGRIVLDKSKPPRERYEPLKAGDLLKQPKLAKALRLLQRKGAAAFYEGAVATDILAATDATGGIMKADDLKNYRVVWRAPLKRQWRGYELYLMPLPSSGGLIMAQGFELLNRLEERFGQKAPLSSTEAHLFGETLKLSFAARGQMGDPMGGTLQNDLTEKLLNPERLDRLAKLVDDDRAIAVMTSKSPDLKEALTTPESKEKTQTTHFSLADREGNAVALTVTLNGSYGSGVVTEKFGIALNDEMDDFNTQPGKANQYGLIQGEANTVAPGKRPLSSMSPTIIDKDGQFFATLGAPGGPRIASAVWQASVRLISQNTNAEDAVTWPRVHHQFLPDTLFHDARRMAPDVLEKLQSFGHMLKDAWIAKVYVVKRTQDGLIEAAADPRGEAAAGGR